jgi:hypothetical protein
LFQEAETDGRNVDEKTSKFILTYSHVLQPEKEEVAYIALQKKTFCAAVLGNRFRHRTDCVAGKSNEKGVK